VVDISGSMNARDNTEKSRWEWAKDAMIHTINELNQEDILSIVIFDTKSEVLLPAQNVTDKDSIIELVTALKTRGSTNLDAGLRDGFEQVSSRLFDAEGFENRVILISDARLNTGMTDDAPLLKLVTDFANENIGLTAIGLGENFNQKFVEVVNKSRGGNSIYAHSGKDMKRYFDSFNLLVTPVAYNFKVALELVEINATFARAYGVPGSEEGRLSSLIDVQTLFFGGDAGGAILLEYDLK